jgi:hypothetical protein
MKKKCFVVFGDKQKNLLENAGNGAGVGFRIDSGGM